MLRSGKLPNRPVTLKEQTAYPSRLPRKPLFARLNHLSFETAYLLDQF